MTTITVWMLILVSEGGGYRGQIDNIATKEECVRIHEVATRRIHHYGSFCMEVKKVKP